MDIIEACQAAIKTQLEVLEEQIGKLADENDSQQSQTFAENAFIPDRDRVLEKILDQQASLPTLIERDGRKISLNKQNFETMKTIEALRKKCAQIERDAMKNKQDLLETQAKELERFQMGQLQSIADDYRRHQEILETRKKEILTMRKDIDNEEKNREAYLIQYEKDLEKSLQARKQLRQVGSSFDDMPTTSDCGVTDELNNPNHGVTLESVDEYAPYGLAPNSRITSNNSSTKRGGSTRGRRQRGGRRGAASNSRRLL